MDGYESDAVNGERGWFVVGDAEMENSRNRKQG